MCGSPWCGKETTIVSVLFLVVTMFEASFAKQEQAYACVNSPGPDGHDCILFYFDCADDKKILIRDVSYVFEDLPNNCKSQHDKCRTHKDGCCVSGKNSVKDSFETEHKYELYKLCSWSKNCTGHRTAYYQNVTLTSKSSVLEYECQPDKNTAHFCVPTTMPIQNKRVNIIFDGTEQIKNYPAHCMCTVKQKKQKESYKISAPDLRLQPASETCNTITTLSGLQETNITCSSRFTSTERVKRKLQRNITVSFQSKPEFIWIEAEAGGVGNEMIVECFADYYITANTTISLVTNSTTSHLTSSVEKTTSHPSSVSSINMSTPTTTMTTSIFPTGTAIPVTSSTLSAITKDALDYVTSSSGHSPIVSSKSAVPTTTTTTDTNEIDTMAVHGIESNDFPIVAVIIPVVVLVGVGAGIIAWLKWRHRRQSETEKPGKCRGQDSRNRPLHAIQNKAYDNTDHLLVNGPVKSSDNYIVLDQENTYTYIDHADAQAGLGNNNDLDPSANVHEPQNECAVEQKKGGNTIKQGTDDSSEPHNYFVLEPQNSVNAEPAYPKNNKTLQGDVTDNEVAQSHDYFVLEPQKPKTETSIQPKATTTRMPGFTERVRNQKYLASEPQDTYSSIDPDDVVIQTLPENEYNMINMKGKATISRDPNYGTLETVDQIGNDIEDSGDYSHIGKSPNKKMDMNEYSHT